MTPPNNRQVINFTLPMSTHYKLRDLSVKSRVPMTRIIQAAVNAYLVSIGIDPEAGDSAAVTSSSVLDLR
jgi:hypothetical protein